MTIILCHAYQPGWSRQLIHERPPIDYKTALSHPVASKNDVALPTYRLHQKLAEMRGKREGIAHFELAALTIKAWNAWITGKSIATLKLVDADRSSAGFPQLQWA